MLDAMVAIETVKKVDEALGIIGKLVAQLKAQPDAAALKLAEALEEIRKTWVVMDDTFTDYLKLGIEQDALKAGSEILLKIEGGELLVQVKNGRGHCSVIRNIYDRYLSRWFERALKGADLAAMHQVFNLLADADDTLFRSMEDLAGQLQKEATEVLDIFSGGNVDGARQRILSTRKQLGPLRLAMSETLAKLYGLKSEFIEISGTV
jgi:hypothetical protein